MTEEDTEIGLQRRAWYVLHVKPRTEKRVFDRLRILGVFRYLPFVKKVTKVQRRKVTRFLPMFPGYVFTRLDPDERRTILGSRQIVRTIEVTEPRRMIHQLRQIAHAGRMPAELRPVTDFTPGEYVRVKSGPLMGLEGYVRRKANAVSIVLVLEILGQAVETTVDPLDLERKEA